ncbi:MAG: hypothetical protein AAFP19_09950 [Bacteroidota bacterium]
MSKSYPPILLHKLADETVIEILQAIIPIFNELEIAYFVVGAFARDIALLARGYDEQPIRKTNDLDLAVMVANFEEFEHLKARINSSSVDFTPHTSEPYRILFKKKYELDLLPFGQIEDEKGDVTLIAKKTVVLNMPGFSNAYFAVETVETDQGFNLKVSSLPGIVLLKLIAWNDRPAERRKDIEDISYIIKNLYLLEIEQIANEDSDILDLLEEFDPELFTYAVAARYLGRKIRLMLKNDKALYSKVQKILEENIQDIEKSDMARIMSFKTLKNAVLIIQQINDGLEDIQPKD